MIGNKHIRYSSISLETLGCHSLFVVFPSKWRELDESFWLYVEHAHTTGAVAISSSPPKIAAIVTALAAMYTSATFMLVPFYSTNQNAQ